MTRQPDHSGSALRFYALLLRLYPAEYRQVFGRQMLQAFHDYYDDTIQNGGRTGILFWLAVLVDEARGIFREQIAAAGEEGTAMKRLNWGVSVDILLLLIVSWYLLTFGHLMAALGRLLPMLILFGGCIWVLARMLSALPAPKAPAPRAWLGYALTFSALWLLVITGQQLIQMFGPTLQDAMFLGMNDTYVPVILIGMPVLFVSLGMLSSYRSGQRRSGVYAGLLAAGIVLVLGTAIAVGLTLAAWPIFQHTVIHSAWGRDYQAWHWTTVWGLLNTELFDWDPGWLGFINAELFYPDPAWLGFLMNVVWAALGSSLGVLISRRASARSGSAGWRGGQLIAVVAFWMLGLGFLLLAVSPHTSSDTGFPPAPLVLQGLRFSVGPLVWLVVLAVVLVSMRRASPTNISKSRALADES